MIKDVIEMNEAEKTELAEAGVVTFKDACSFLGISLSTLRTMVDEGTFPIVYVRDNSPRVWKLHLQQFLRSKIEG